MQNLMMIVSIVRLTFHKF